MVKSSTRRSVKPEDVGSKVGANYAVLARHCLVTVK